jgi:hypothetical protein
MFGGPNFDKKYKLEMLEEKHACKKQRLLEFPNGIPPHPKYSSQILILEDYALCTSSEGSFP